MRLPRVAALGILVLALGITVLVCRACRMVNEPYFGPARTEVFVDIPAGASAHDIASSLAASGVIRNPYVFEGLVRWLDVQTELKAGEYRFEVPASPREVVRRLVAGDVFFQSVTVVEGLTATETISCLTAAGIGAREELEQAIRRTYLIRDFDHGAGSLEGYLFPDTYRFPRRCPAGIVIATLVERFREKYAGVVSRLKAAPSSQVDPRIVTLASIIEKEAGIPAERPLVASVLANRLSRGMALAVDPTIIYALKLAGTYNGNLRKSDLSLDSPYNTYLHPGLPPGPICSPGEDSLRAALAPATTDYLYYVSRNDGTHEFSRDYQSHVRAVAHFQPKTRKAAVRHPD